MSRDPRWPMALEAVFHFRGICSNQNVPSVYLYYHWEGKWPLLHFSSPSPSPFYLNCVYVNRQLLRFLHPPTNRPISSATEPSCNKRAHVTWPTFIDKQSSRNLLSIVGVSRSVHLHIRHSRFSLIFRTNRPLGPIKTASGEDYLYR